MKNIILTCLILFIAGCVVSPYHLGFRQWDNCKSTCRTLNIETAKASKSFEEQIIQLIINNDIDGLRKHFTDKFSKNITQEDLSRMSTIIDGYHFIGEFKPDVFTGRSFSMDEASRWDGFKAYDYIAAIYKLKGKQEDALLILGFQKFNKNLKLLGLSLFNADQKIANDNNSFKYLFLDNLDTEESVSCPCGMLLSMNKWKQ